MFGTCFLKIMQYINESFQMCIASCLKVNANTPSQQAVIFLELRDELDRQACMALRQVIALPATATDKLEHAQKLSRRGAILFLLLP